MPKGVQRDWPSDDELRKFAGEVNGNVREGARRMGVARATLNDHLDARGLKVLRSVAGSHLPAILLRPVRREAGGARVVVRGATCTCASWAASSAS